MRALAIERKILVVDRLLYIRSTEPSPGQIFRDLGFSVVCAGSAAQAIDTLRAGDTSIATCFIDHQMPLIDGLLLCAAVQSDETPPICIVSSGPKFVNYVGRLGVRAWIRKPFSKKDIERVLDRFDVGRQK